jgi:hypothetical protein
MSKHRQITDVLSTHNYGRLFNAPKEPPVKLQSDTKREYANVLEKWEEKHNACNFVRATLGFNAREIVKPVPEQPFNRLHEVLETDRIGRKPVLIFGCAGTMFSMILVGFSSNIWIALLGRTTGGLLNGNIGVIQTMVGELITKPEHERKYQSDSKFTTLC